MRNQVRFSLKPIWRRPLVLREYGDQKQPLLKWSIGRGRRRTSKWGISKSDCFLEAFYPSEYVLMLLISLKLLSSKFISFLLILIKQWQMVKNILKNTEIRTQQEICNFMWSLGYTGSSHMSHTSYMSCSQEECRASLRVVEIPTTQSNFWRNPFYLLLHNKM